MEKINPLLPKIQIWLGIINIKKQKYEKESGLLYWKV